MLGPVRRSHCAALAALAALLLLLLARLPPPAPPAPRPAALPPRPSPPPRPSTPPRASPPPPPAPLGNRSSAPPSAAPATTAPPATTRRNPRVVLVRDLYVAGHSRPHPELCPALGARLRLLVLVTSAPSHAAARDAVRLTWGHYAARADVAVAFVLGAPPPALAAAIEAEDALYGDVIVGRSVDSYSNLTLKTLSMLEWADTYCPRAPRLLKTDDDMFINIPRLLQFAAAPARANATRTIWGKVMRRSLPKRTTKSKYYVSPLQFPGRVFPDFATGPAYLLTADCVRGLLAAAPRARYVRLEDVFVTGVLAAQLGLRRAHAPEFYNKRVAAHPCAVQRGLAIHMVRYHEQFDLWRKLLDGKTNSAPPSAAPATTAPPATTRRNPRVVLVRDLYVAGHSRPHPELCPALGARLRLLVLVTSAPSHAAARDAVRLTWGHYAARADVAVAFVLGAPPPALAAAIEAEDALYGDVIVGRSVDSYSNLTLKTLSMLEWADTYCPRAPRLLKTDDDMFINIPRLLQFAAAPARANATRTIWGKRVKKLQLPFPGRVFLDYAAGPAYLLTADCVRGLLAAAPRARYVRLEDVFVTGVLAAQLGLRRAHAPEFYNKRVAAHPCAVQRGLAIHMVRYHEQFDLWRKLLDGNIECAS